MKLLPVALKVEGARVLVVGGGAVAARKAGVLRECGARVHVISPNLCAELEAIKTELEHSQRHFQSEDCNLHQLVFACTNNAKVNSQIADEAQSKNIWFQIADDANRSTLHGAATIRRDEICIGITTGGASPALAKHLKTEIENCVGNEYSQLLQLMSSRRHLLKSQIYLQSERAQIWREILDGGVLRELREGRTENAANLIDELFHSKLKDQNSKF